MTYQLPEPPELKFTLQYNDALITEYGQACYQAGRDSMKSECVKAVDDAGGDNTDYHMNAMKELK